MRLNLIDAVLHADDERVVVVKRVLPEEDFVQDHFPTFPVMPGVMMLETMIQAARRLLAGRDPALARHVLGEVRAVKYGAMVRPGEGLRVEVRLTGEKEAGVFDFKGQGVVLTAEQLAEDAAGAEGRTAVSGRFSLRPVCLPATPLSPVE
ncbi:MAG: hypothetical protein VYC34_03925 [Planctomycetota bacterium]|nr:hypothetical protein [Planctomycetota bacterium]